MLAGTRARREGSRERPCSPLRAHRASRSRLHHHSRAVGGRSAGTATGCCSTRPGFADVVAQEGTAIDLDRLAIGLAAAVHRAGRPRSARSTGGPSVTSLNQRTGRSWMKAGAHLPLLVKRECLFRAGGARCDEGSARSQDGTQRESAAHALPDHILHRDRHLCKLPLLLVLDSRRSWRGLRLGETPRRSAVDPLDRIGVVNAPAKVSRGRFRAGNLMGD